jgi:hypothetical protein
MVRIPDDQTSHGFNNPLWITSDTPRRDLPLWIKFALQTIRMFWGVRDRNARLYLVSDDSAADAIADEWERSGGQLVYKRPTDAYWQPAGLPEQQWLLEAAHTARRARQALLGEMEP